MKQIAIAVSCALVVFAWSGNTHAEDIREELKDCARTENAERRSACYEELGSRVLAADTVPAQPVQSATPTDAPVAEPVAESVAPAATAAAAATVVVETATPEPVATQSTAPETAATNVTNAAEVAEADQLPDDMGGAAFEKKEPADEEDRTARGHIVECRKAADDRWVFWFENGQVWKQAETRNTRMRECDVWATVTETKLGYNMKIDDKKGIIRIERVR